MPSLPDLPPFNECAVDLHLYARSAAEAVFAGEVMRARGGWAGGFSRSIEELRSAAAISGKVYEFFRWAGETPEREQLIRDFLSGLETVGMSPPRQQRSAG